MKYLFGFLFSALSLNKRSSTRFIGTRSSVKLMTVILLSVSPVCFSQSDEAIGYITDRFFVPIRSGPGNDFRIIKHNIYTGTRLQLLDDGNPKDPWSKVRLKNGTEGFIRSQYISSKPIARTQLNSLTASVEQLTAEKNALLEENQLLKNQQSTLQTNLSNAENQGSATSQELERIRRVSSEALQLHSRHQTLLERVEVMKTEIDVLKAENGRLIRKEKEIWVLLGAGLVLLGVIITISAQRFRPRKKYSEWA